LDELARRMGDISKQGLSKFETGQASPNSARLIQLSKALGVKPEYFLRADTVALAPLEFRKLAKMPLYRQEQVKELMRDQLERYVLVERSFEDGVSSRLVAPRSIPVKSLDEAESAASKLRQEWGVGVDAIADLTDLLESKGFKIALIDAGDDFDGACAATTDEKNVLIALNGNRPGERMRFTVAHEVGHWVMDLPSKMSEKDKERCCHRFAAALLFPSVQVKDEFGEHQRSRVHPQELLNAKHSYGVSMQMILYRLKDLGLLSDVGHKSLSIMFGKYGWRRNEPGTLPSERPRRFESLVFRGIAEEIFTLSRAAELLQIPIGRLNASSNGELVHE